MFDARSDADIARGFEVSPQALSSFKKQEKFPSDLLINYCLSHQVSIDWLLTGENPKYREEKKQEQTKDSHTHTKEKQISGQSLTKWTKGETPIRNAEQKDTEEELLKVSRYDINACAGTGGGNFIHEKNEVEQLAFTKQWIKGVMKLNPKQISIISVAGDSMEPTLYEYDFVLVDHRDTGNKSDGIYVINYDNSLMVKRLQFTPNGLYIKSDNKNYREIFIPVDSGQYVNVVGRVVWVGKRM